MKILLSAAIGLAVAAVMSGGANAAETIRIGLIGLDSSHAIAFSKSINAEPSKPELAGAKIVAAFPGGSPDIAASTDRIEGFTKQISDMGIEIVPSIEVLLKKVDAVVINSVDGRVHLKQVKPVFEAGIPVFVDKPMTGSLAEAKELVALSKKTGTPFFSCSCLRYCDDVVALQKENAAGNLVGCVAFSPCTTDPTHPDLYWYGIHGVETLFTVMGPGCVSLQRTKVDGVDVVTGVWKDGRVGTFRGIRDGSKGYGVLAFGEKKNEYVPIRVSYEPMLVEVVKFFHTKKPPISPEETLEIMAFMTAADVSRDLDGKSVTLESVLNAK
ncbi:Gfo/Idh/MocA family oxidoreductase [Blastopirellula sp. JC732]|uniref:Gfo/Idh/MocA family oxidoreductase n=1 Tax=Blastopirellula sediminis TaxID=2894196 RepID=A0A9X1MN58_9BACT|nr:Gfo/Idh/MocA family oxidoreductase [Blastopirellula sediminis]MCC9608674.1 Gfo/Idh/MocA family oxidoreductase [Blastopirellula sediminis]MCC9628549.1 Gfo/Idh/MocA family oxidoreductase [Blastopirellula sediminis]